MSSIITDRYKLKYRGKIANSNKMKRLTMNSSKTLKPRLQTGTITKRSADQEDNISSSLVENEVHFREPRSATGHNTC